MIWISHRGNVSGKNIDRENTVSFIEEAIEQGFDVEIDICKWDGSKFYLGHDVPAESIDVKWLKSRPLWVHAKDHLVLHELVKKNIHCTKSEFKLTLQHYSTCILVENKFIHKTLLHSVS